MIVDHEIIDSVETGWIGIEPFDRQAVQPASYDVTLDRHFLLPDPDIDNLDLADLDADHMHPLSVGGGGLVVEPGDFILGSTRETISLPSNFLGRIEGKSSIGRVGLLIHVTAGFIDPGFTGQVTLEIFNVAPWSITIYPGQRIAQIAFTRLTAHPSRAYGRAGNHYQGQSGPVASRFEMGRSPVQEGLT